MSRLKFVASILVCNYFSQTLPAQVTQPYQKALVQLGYQPTGEGARQLLRAIVPEPNTTKQARELLELLNAADYQQREAATKQLLQLPNLPFALLNQAASSGSAEVRWRARHVLKHSQEKSSRLLLAALKIISEDPPQDATADVLAVVPYCRQEYEVAALHNALRSVAVKDDQPLFVERLLHPNASMRAAAIVGLVQVLGADAADTLQPLLRDPDDTVALAVARELADVGDRRSLDCLVRLLGSDDSTVRAESSNLLRLMTGENFGYVAYWTPDDRESVIARWQQWLAANGSTAKLHYPLERRLSARGRLKANTLVSTGSKGKVMELDPTGKPVWTYDLAAWSAEKLTNGNVLIASYTSKKVVEVDSAGNVVWEFNGVSAMSAKPLLSGNFLIADFAGRRVIEVDRTKRIVWQYDTKAQCFDADRLTNGNTIYGCPNKIGEVTPDGEPVAEWQIPGRLNGFQALSNGNLLVANYGQSKVYELTRDGEVVWELAEEKPCDVYRLEDGRVLVSTAKRIIEVAPDKTVVRVLTDARYGSARR